MSRLAKSASVRAQSQRPARRAPPGPSTRHQRPRSDTKGMCSRRRGPPHSRPLPGGVAPPPPQTPQPVFLPTHTRRTSPSTGAGQVSREGQEVALRQPKRQWRPATRGTVLQRIPDLRWRGGYPLPPPRQPCSALRCARALCDEAADQTPEARIPRSDGPCQPI